MPSDTLKLSVGHPDSRKGIAYAERQNFIGVAPLSNIGVRGGYAIGGSSRFLVGLTDAFPFSGFFAVLLAPEQETLPRSSRA